MANSDELNEFLDLMHWVMPNLNDTFGYATADSERLYMDQEENQEWLVKMFRKYGHDGIVAYCAKVRAQDPIPPCQTEKYFAAMKDMSEWEYDGD